MPDALKQLRDYAAAVLAVIDARGLEGAQHITPKSSLAHQCRDELENASHYLTRLLFALPHVNGQEGRVLSFPFESLTIEQHSIAQAADGLLRDANVGLFGGQSYDQRQHYGTTSVPPIVCRQLREGITLLNGLLGSEQQTIQAPVAAELLDRLAILFGDSGGKMLQVVNDPDLSTDQKLWAMDRIDQPLMVSIRNSETLGEVLGVSASMIRKCSWWIEGQRKRSRD